MLISYTSKAQLQKDSSLHKKNIFTLAFYKQPGKDSMVDFVDGIYRVLKINKDRSIGETISHVLWPWAKAAGKVALVITQQAIWQLPDGLLCQQYTLKVCM